MSRWRERLPRVLTTAPLRETLDRLRNTPWGGVVFEVAPYVLVPLLGALSALAPSFFDTRETFIVIVLALYLMLRITESWYSVVVLALTLVLVPTEMNSFERNIMFNVALYALLGIGLNVVVGYAGLLDLGYVAFFAAGAYIFAIVVAPDAGAPEWAQQWDWGLTFWVVLPMALVAAALIGVLLGVPVLRLRGDYLAIVTLGFGEIMRIMLNNEDYYTSGPRGIFLLPKTPFFGRELRSAYELYFIVLAVALIAVFASERIRDSRVGRAWEAIREDEDVASAMGIDTTYYKLLAFAIGAAIGGAGGVIIAAKQGSVNPVDFNLDVSINVLAVVIIGGMGNVRGVLLAAFLVAGLPDVLRDFSVDLGFIAFENVGSDYRLVIFGAALVAVMVLRPEGILPSRRRKAEFEQVQILESELAV